MTIEYETVFMSRGPVTAGQAPKGFATRHYDKSPSPISLAGGGTTSVFGVGGVLAGLFGLGGDKSAFSDIEGGGANTKGSFLKRAIQTANRFKNLKKLNKEGLRQEGFNIIKEGLGKVGGTSVSGVANTLFPKNTPNLNVTKALLKGR